MGEHSCHWRRTAEQRAEQVREQQAEIEAIRAERDGLVARVSELEQKLEREKKQILGPKSERMPTPEEEQKKREPKDPKNQGGYKNPGKRRENKKKEETLRVEVIPHPVPDEERRCPQCGQEAKAIGNGDISTELEWVPGHFVKRMHHVETARCPCKQHYVRGPAPVRVQEGGKYGPGFIAKLIVDRCSDAIPLHRVEKALDREGLHVARSTMGDLVHFAAELLKPLRDIAFAELREDPYLQADETSFRTQIRRERSYLWTFLSEHYTLYFYATSRSGDTPNIVLGGSTGVLTVDGHTGYNVVTNVNGRDRTGCFSHARRRFFEALSTAPEARKGLDIILDLFMTERDAKARGLLGTDAHLRLRKTKSVEALDRLLAWAKETEPLYEPRSAMGTALYYLQNQWDRLTAFVDDPKIPIHNNASESALRIIALVRKNSLFFGSDGAGERFAVLHSLVATCEKHNVNPIAYLTDVLLRIQVHPKARLAELLPHRWKAMFAAPP